MFNKDANVKKFSSDTRLATKAIHAGHDPTEWRSRALVTPIVTSVTFACKENEPMDYLYARCGNPTRSCLERTLAALEEGQYALCFTSGMTAITAVVCLLSNGDHILSSDDVFGGSHFLMKNGVSRFQMTTTFVDCTDVEKVRRALKSNTKLVWLETLTNPLMKVLDIKAIVEAVKADRPDILIAVDNTFSTPVFQQPLNLGADIVVHSLTKYMNGHCDVCLGSIVTRNKDIYQRLSFAQRTLGPVPSPFDCYLVCRGLKTLPVRMRQHEKNALDIACFLEGHPMVKKVLYPGLESHPQHEVAKKQCRGFSGMISFYIRGGKEEAKTFVNNLRIFTSAVSLGCVASLVEIPADISHNAIEEEYRLKNGITDNLIRLSVGLEDTEDLLNDLQQALDKTVSV
ncbi:putative cystathionine gamma-lyase 2 isoform X1 [Tachypleus tridentatus]|uniref:putative cystathionine gamma-lyase 2 isoform X1 n=1 Tax=Tachypleus tridentatus TaxID=6853 RepID=UPI003FD13AF4